MKQPLQGSQLNPRRRADRVKKGCLEVLEVGSHFPEVFVPQMSPIFEKTHENSMNLKNLKSLK